MVEMADGRCETEIKLLIAAERPADVIGAIAHLPTIDGRPLGQARSSVLRDTYFDTPDRQLYERHFNLRARSEDGTLLLTLKGPKTRLPSGVAIRAELESAWSREALERVRGLLAEAGIDLCEAPGVAEPARSMRAAGLVPLQTRHTRRRARDVVDASGMPFAELVLDVVTYEIGGREICHHELEIEAHDAAHAVSLVPLAHDLLARFGDVLRLWRSGKLTTGLAVQELLRDGSLDDHVTEGNLRPSAYDLIERHVAATMRERRRGADGALTRRGAVE
jgi:inorganic triphosphatase YgiF